MEGRKINRGRMLKKEEEEVRTQEGMLQTGGRDHQFEEPPPAASAAP